jgi:hypothetical protein
LLVTNQFPTDEELLAFFESEPKVLSPGDPWFMNTLEFTTVRADITVHCRITPTSGEMTTQITMSGHELAKFELEGAETIRIITSAGQEALEATFAKARGLGPFVLMLKPRVWAAWGNVRQWRE